MKQRQQSAGSLVGERDTVLARRLMDIAGLVAETRDLRVVGAVIVAECMDLLGVDAAALLMATDDGLRSVTSSGGAAVALGALQQATGRGPSAHAVKRGVVVDASLEEATRRWPEWAREARTLGVARVTVQPLCLVDQPLGALELDMTSGEPLDPADRQVLKVFAGLAVVLAAHSQEREESSRRVEQLEGALHSRVQIEQAKGFLLARGLESTSRAFEMMRRHARGTGRHLGSVAADVLDGKLDAQQLEGR